DATRQIKKKLPETEVLIFTGQETEELVHDVFDSGARSYIMKTDAADHLIDALKALSEHKHFFTSRISEIVFARYIQGKKVAEGTPEKSRITDREREIVQLLAEGKSSKEIATILGISVRTVETHRAAIMKKLGLKSFSELIRYAVRNKIIEAQSRPAESAAAISRWLMRRWFLSNRPGLRKSPIQKYRASVPRPAWGTLISMGAMKKNIEGAQSYRAHHRPSCCAFRQNAHRDCRGRPGLANADEQLDGKMGF